MEIGFECTASADTLQVQWWFETGSSPLSVDDQVIDSRGGRVALLAQSGVYWNLQLSRLTLEDAGIYLCRVPVAGRHRPLERKVELQVLRPPRPTPPLASPDGDDELQPHVGELAAGTSVSHTRARNTVHLAAQMLRRLSLCSVPSVHALTHRLACCSLESCSNAHAHCVRLTLFRLRFTGGGGGLSRGAAN